MMDEIVRTLAVFFVLIGGPIVAFGVIRFCAVFIVPTKKRPAPHKRKSPDCGERLECLARLDN